MNGTPCQGHSLSFSSHFLNIFSFLHKKIIEQFFLYHYFSPRKSTQEQIFIKVLYNVQTFTTTVPTECRRCHKDCFYNEAMQGHGMIQKWDTKFSKWNHKDVQQCGWLTKKKGHNLIHQTERPVPDSWGWRNSLNQPNYCTKKPIDLLKAHHHLKSLVSSWSLVKAHRDSLIVTLSQVCYRAAFPELIWICLNPICTLETLEGMLNIFLFSLVLLQMLLKLP